MSEAPKILCSIVSHDQADLLANLLQDLNALNLGDNVRVIVTENTSRPNSLELTARSSLHCTGHLKTIHNKTELGFGANHNQAFNQAEFLFLGFIPDVYLVLNPDLRVSTDVINELGRRIVADPSIGVLAPEIFTSGGQLEDSARYTPTLARITRKLFFNDRGMYPRTADQPYEPDIICGMCLAFNVISFRRITGFDEAYFMYYEDADVCLRLKAIGQRVVVEPALCVVHDAQRQSQKNIRMLGIHLSSMLRFFSSKFKR